jgi:hypothetical protein
MLNNKEDILKKIEDLKKIYEIRHLYSGTAGFKLNCSCCGDETHNVENLYNKDPKKNDGISLCFSCSILWRNNFVNEVAN